MIMLGGLRIFNRCLTAITGIIGYKSKLNLVPISDLDRQREVWVSTGVDPAFLLEGNFFGGWNSITWDSESTTNIIPVKLYWDDGSGFSEDKSSYLTSIVPGVTRYQVTFHIPLGVKKLRIDPGEQELGFKLSNVRLKKTTKYHIMIKYILQIFKQRGFSIRMATKLIKKGIKIYETEGLEGLKQKIKKANSGSNENNNYELWLLRNAITDAVIQEAEQAIRSFTYTPRISVILPVYNVDEIWLRKCIDSVINQIYKNWELCISDDASTKPHVKEVLNQYAERYSQIKVVYREKNGHISECSNSALAIATGEFIGLLDHDDELSRDALYENVKLLNMYPDADLIYSDEDKITEEGERHSPFFKPDWSPDLLLSQMYICHFSIYRKTIIDQIGGFRKGYEGSQDYDLALRFTELTDAIYHIPKVLYHWRTIPESTASGAQAKNYTHYAGLKALIDTLKRRNVDGIVKEIGDYSNMFRVSYNLEEEPLVSIIIPTRNMGELLDSCLNSIFSRSLYSNFEVIIIDNGSTEEHTLSVFKKWTDNHGGKIRILPIDIPFNYSKLNNIAVQAANGEYILLLNNDIEVISEDWLGEMVGYAQRRNTGAVGTKLLYTDDTIQHAGVVMGLGGVAGHAFRTLHKSDPGYFGALLVNRNCSVVTAACLMIKKDLYIEVGGLEEELTVAFNDVDLCLKLLDRGLNNICLNSIELYHHESKSRGAEDTPEKKKRFQGEIDYILNKWSKYIEKDPYYNINLSLESDKSYMLKTIK